MQNKRVAQHSRSFFGGTPTVHRYYNDEETAAIDIMTCIETTLSAPVCATVGLCQKDTGLYVEKNRLGVELITAARVDPKRLEDLLAALALNVEGEELQWGSLLPPLPPQLCLAPSLRNIVLLSPPFWPTYKPLREDDEVTVWLYALPVTNAEADYLLQNGAEVFEQKMEQSGVDVLDPARPSCI